jgi:SAM-dependent methyltransferase
MSNALTSSSPVHSTLHVCPWWLGWTLVLPVRRWFLNPDKCLGSLVPPGGRALEIGPGTGFFSIPLAERLGPTGRLWCVDLQPQMLATLGRRLRRRGLAERVTCRTCTAGDLGVADLTGSIDLAVLIYVLHEVPDPERALAQVVDTLRVGGRLLLVEPNGHCSPELFARQLRICEALGLERREDQLDETLEGRQAAVLEKMTPCPG